MQILNREGASHYYDIPTLICSVRHFIPSEFPFFDVYISRSEFIAHIIFWAYKDITLDKAIRQSFGEHTESKPEDEGYEADSHKLRRAIRAVVARKLEDAQRLGTCTDYYETVLNKEKRNQEVRPSYHLNDADTMAVDLLCDKSSLAVLLRDGRMVDSKKISGKRIADAHKKYYQYLKLGGHRNLDSEEWIMNLFDISSLESMLCPSLLFEIADFMEARNLKRILPAVDILFQIVPVQDYEVQSRFLGVRNRFIPLLLQESEEKVIATHIYLDNLLKLHFGVLYSLLNDEKSRSILESMPADVARHYFEDSYNLFEVCSNPKWENDTWSPSLIKRYRFVVNELTDATHWTWKKNESEQDVK